MLWNKLRAASNFSLLGPMHTGADPFGSVPKLERIGLAYTRGLLYPIQFGSDPLKSRVDARIRSRIGADVKRGLFSLLNIKPWPNDANIYPNKCQHCWALLDIVGCGVAKRTQHLYPTFICLSQQHQQQQQHRINYSTLRSRIRFPPPPLSFLETFSNPCSYLGPRLLNFLGETCKNLVP